MVKVVDELIFRFYHLESKIKKIHDFVKSLKDNFEDEKKGRRLIAIARDCKDDHKVIQDICLRLNNSFIKEPSSKPDNFDINAKLFAVQDLMFDIEAAVHYASLSLSDQNQTETKVELNNSADFGSFSSLPTIKLTEFDGGSLLEWLNFRDLFEALVVNDSKIPKIKKFMYLRSCVKGDALSLITSIAITADNFDLAWKLLCDRYNDEKSLTNIYLESLIDLPNIYRTKCSLNQSATNIKECLGILSQLGHSIDEWNPLLIFIFKRKLVKELVEKWESSILSTSAPTHKDFVEFLINEAKIIEGMSTGSGRDKAVAPKRIKPKPLVLNNYSPSPTSSPSCLYCRKNHSIIDCTMFIQNSPKDRFHFVKANSLCGRCLSNKHYLKDCPSGITCCYCKSANHSSLLHFDSKPKISVGQYKHETRDSEKSQSVTNCSVVSPNMHTSNTVLLSTAVAYIKNKFGKVVRVRMLLDTGSQGTFVTKSLIDKIKLPIEVSSVPIQGMAHTNLGLSLGKVSLTLNSPSNNLIPFELEALIVNEIAKCPQVKLENKLWPHLEGIKLADPTWFQPGDIDLLIGSEYLAQMLLGHIIIGPKGTPSAISTIWGYTLVGKVPGSSPLQTLCTLTDLDSTLKRFWALEEPPSVTHISEDDKICNEIFDKTISRLETGRFAVTLPFRKNRSSLGDSRKRALHRFNLLESRLLKNPQLYEKYKEFMLDYSNQGHMIIAKPLLSDKECYYVPHHCIQNPKFKVVFDFSMNTVNGPSLNQVLYSGEKLLISLLDIILKFRLYPVVLIADINQFYRNISMLEEYRDYQRIFWRDDPSKPLLEWCLTTVTYGVVSSPYLAIKTLQKLVEFDGANYPLASSALLESTYMDDIVRSVRNLEEGFQLRRELIDLLGKGGFKLKKWVSNSPELLEGLDKGDLLATDFDFSFLDSENPAKILGLAWNPVSDKLSFRINVLPQEITKRKILSELAQVWDPLGFLSPAVFIGKLILRFIWQAGIDWDDTPSQEVCSQWTRFRTELPLLTTKTVPRLLCHSPGSVQIHCFADASELGFGSVLYFRHIFQGEINISMVLAKSKIAPLKKISIPRLELCSLVLAAKLVNYILNLFHFICFDSILIWSDSTVALHWVKASPHRWKTFVANRVTYIQELTLPSSFRYVPSNLNIADLASRGCFPSELISNPSWWAGPEFLRFPEESWPEMPSTLISKDIEIPETKEVKVFTSLVSQPFDILNKFNSLTKLRRVTAWCLRFLDNCRKNSNSNKLYGPLSTFELNRALSIWIKFVQQEQFDNIFLALKSNKLLPSNFRKLNPFIDQDGILRVGGRLQNSSLSFSIKHPILIPKSSSLTNMIIDFYHTFWLHPGPSTLHSIIRNQFWILSGRSIIRNRLLKCIKCFRCKPTNIQPLMGNLPPSRLRQIKPFGISGVDYAGPILIKSSHLRKAIRTKAYVCLFVCFATKAIHLELASDLSTNTFLAAFRRFVSRRGPIYEMHSDNGTNFIGANNKLDSLKKLVSSKNFLDQAQFWLGEQGIKWSFIPSFSAHMGCIWEANIKSTKRLLYASIGAQVLTFEELYTVLVQIEAVLNSRPLTPLSSDPNDLEILTPSHFLVQGPPGSIIEPYQITETLTLRKRWNLVQQIVSSFWSRWQKEYLSSMQLRYKWNKPAPNLQVGTLVLLKDPNLPPMKWKIGRIVQTFPGNDGIVRVADVKLSTGVVSRAVVKLCPLPLEE